jgi:hypothetical protein
MAKKLNIEPQTTEITKTEVVIDHGDIIQIWKYDKKMGKNAYEVENVYKGESKFSKIKKESK